MIKDLVHRNAMAVLFTAKNVPEVSLDVIEVKALGGSLYRVRTRLSNPKAMPTMSYLAQKINLYPKDMLRAGGAGAKVVAGGLLVDPTATRSSTRNTGPSSSSWSSRASARSNTSFLVEGKGELTVRYESRHGGKLTKTVKLE